jgi:8-oxo-dGTP pyrophosphatase MutT (NUDIX family)
MDGIVEKVTSFITRDKGRGPEILLFEHPYAGIQIPAGTVEADETPEEAALREAGEETNLTDLSIVRRLSVKVQKLPGDRRMITRLTKVFARPDLISYDWASIRRGIVVTLKKEKLSFSQILFQEFDQMPEPQDISFSILGWVPTDALTDTYQRHFYLLTFTGDSQDRWSVFTDHHRFSLFWAHLNDLPQIIYPQNKWLQELTREIP